MGNLLQWWNDQIKDGWQSIHIDFALGFVYTA